MRKKLLSVLLSAAMALNFITILPLNAYALSGESRSYEKDGYTITYKIGSEWENNRTVEVNIKNTGEESILNWALKYDVGGEMSNLWNSKLYDKGEDYVIIKNNGYNYEIEPEQSVSCGYIVTGKETVIPEDIELCSRRIDVSTGYDVDFNITSDWHTGFQAEVTIENTSTEPIEAWTLLFDGNFTINNIWNAKLLSSENGKYEVANQLWTTPIKAGESASFGFTADKSATENAKAENFQLTAVVIGKSVLEKDPDDPDNPNDDIDYELDTDEDGLPDYYEEILGTDKNKADTDDDGLSDGAEINTHGTDPLKYDTDGDGISDGDEITLGLNPSSGSTDGTPDGDRTFTQTVDAESEVLSVINNNESVPFDVSLEMKAAGVAENNVYVRESGYSNAIENSAIIGVAPEFVYTDGLTVEEVTVKFELENSVINNTLGTYTDESDEFKGIKRLNVFMFFEDVNMLLPVETFHDETTNTVYTKTDRVGTYCLVDMEIFLDNLDKQLNGDDEPEAGIDVQSEESEAMSENTLDNNTFLSYNVSRVELDSAKVTTVSDSGYKDGFYVNFLVDSRITYSSDFAIIKRNILETCDTIFELSPNAKIRFIRLLPVEYGSREGYEVITNPNSKFAFYNEYFTDYESVSDALAELERVGVWDRYDSCNVYPGLAHAMRNTPIQDKETYCFYVLKKHSSQYNYENAKNDEAGKGMTKKVTISVASDYKDNRIDKSTYTFIPQLCDNTGGKIISDYEFSDKALEVIYGSVPEVKNSYKAITALGYKTVVLNQSLQDNYNMYNESKKPHTTLPYLKEFDTDEDTIADYNEIMFEYKITSAQGNVSYADLITLDDSGNVVLPTFDFIVYQVVDLAYVEKGLKRYCDVTGESVNSAIQSLNNVKILPIKSDPTSEDGDEDGYVDGSLDINSDGKVNDPRPLKCDVYKYSLGEDFVPIYKNSTENYYGGNQGWYNVNTATPNKIISNGGCGVISLCDTLTYLDRSGKYPEITPICSFGIIAKEDYMDFIEYIYKYYLLPIRVPDIISNGTGTYGVLPQMYVNGYKNYMLYHHLSLPAFSYATTNIVLDNSDDLFKKIENKIENDYPVPLFIELFSKVTFYEKNDMSQHGDKPYNYHWVTITGTERDDVTGEKLIHVASWGDELIIKYNDLYDDGLTNSTIVLIS